MLRLMASSCNCDLEKLKKKIIYNLYVACFVLEMFFFYFLISDDKEITPSSLLQEWGHAKLGVCFFFLKVIQLLVDSLLSIPFIL